MGSGGGIQPLYVPGVFKRQFLNSSVLRIANLLPRDPHTARCVAEAYLDMGKSHTRPRKYTPPLKTIIMACMAIPCPEVQYTSTEFTDYLNIKLIY